MSDPVTVNLRHVTRGLGIPLEKVESVVALLDEGNTIPFIARYRKDQTGGLDEELIREIQFRLEKMRQLAERKQTILRSIESQGKLTEKLDKQIRDASTAKRLEDLYLPFKPKKKSLATDARNKGLAPLAQEILDAAEPASDLTARAADFVDPEKGVASAEEAITGAGHIIAEIFSETLTLRQRLREIIHRNGKLISTKIEDKSDHAATASQDNTAGEDDAHEDKPSTDEPAEVTPTSENTEETPEQSPVAEEASAVETDAEAAANAVAEEVVAEETTAEAPPVETAESTQQPPATGSGEGGGDGLPEDAQPDDDKKPEEPTAEAEEPTAEEASTEEAAVVEATAEEPATEEKPEVSEEASANKTPESPEAATPETQTAAPETATKAEQTTEPASESTDQPAAKQPVSGSSPQKSEADRRKNKRRKERERRKRKALEKKQEAFNNYFSYSEEVRKIPPHRVLALNRGERANVLRIKVENDLEAMSEAANELCVPADHPHAELLRGCVKGALSRLVLPSLEREVRRELTEKAEQHAVSVFARNLRNLLLQPPIKDRRVLALDPGLKHGCKMAALDQFGNVLGHHTVFLIGKAEHKEHAKEVVLDLIRRFQLSVIAIGNGTGCREAEEFVGELINNELKDENVAYVIVNEAGASVYSTSQIGREEFPEYDALLRGAISIGRRLQDPLSELVKIDPANIGVGLYQHDVKAKHLRDSLESVIESCVNYVGANVNTSSPSLLKQVSGLNQLTARRLYEHRKENGPFRTRQQLMDVSGLGEATFVQAAGFLKIDSGENPLDATWIHPESYEVAEKILAKLEFQPDDLRDKEKTKSLAEKAKSIDLESTAEELGIGTLLLRDILAQFTRPGRDPREDLPAPIFKKDVLKIEDLESGMELKGTVLNVVDFGAFVDIGMHDSGLVHVSQLANRYVRDAHDVVAVGDIVTVWVVEVDKERRRVSLTMIQPGSEHDRSHGDRRRPSGEQRTEEGGGEKSRQGGGRGRGRQDGESRSDRGGERRESKPRGDRRAGGGRRPRDGKSGGRNRGKFEFKPRVEKPKIVKPLTDDMKAGEAPLRSFSDLAQFFGRIDATQEDQGKKKKPKKARTDAAKPSSGNKEQPADTKPEMEKPVSDKPETGTPDVETPSSDITTPENE